MTCVDRLCIGCVLELELLRYNLFEFIIELRIYAIILSSSASQSVAFSGGTRKYLILCHIYIYILYQNLNSLKIQQKIQLY